MSALVGRVHGAVGPLPVAQYAQAFEVLTLLVNLLGGKCTALGLHVVPSQVAAMQFFDGVFNWQAVAVPARDVLRIKTAQLLALDNHVLENFVQRVANMQFAVGVGRAVVQDKKRGTLAGIAQALVEAILVPGFDPGRFPLGQIAAHRERGVRQIQGAAVILFVSHGGAVLQSKSGHRGSLAQCQKSARSESRTSALRAVCGGVPPL